MGSFIGAETALDHLKNGVTRRRVGFIVEGPPARGQHTAFLLPARADGLRLLLRGWGDSRSRLTGKNR